MKKILRKIGFVAASFIAGITSAFAAVPADVSTALGDLKVDTTTVASLAFSAFLVLILFVYMRKATN